MSAPVLKIDSLELRRGERVVLRDVDLEIARGERVALMGLSGGGKTTVLRAVVALEAFDGGTIDVDGVALRPGPVPKESALRALRAKVGMVFQMHCLFEHLTALGNVTLAPVNVFGRDRANAEKRAHELLEALGAGHRHDALPRELSGGEAQRVAIARALAVDPPLLLMDEPTASLDPARRNELAVLLRNLADQGRTLVVSTHDVDFARDFASRIVVLAKGEIVEQGPPSSILEDPQHPETRRLLQGEK